MALLRDVNSVVLNTTINGIAYTRQRELWTMGELGIAFSNISKFSDVGLGRSPGKIVLALPSFSARNSDIPEKLCHCKAISMLQKLHRRSERLHSVTTSETSSMNNPARRADFCNAAVRAVWFSSQAQGGRDCSLIVDQQVARFDVDTLTSP